LKLSELGEREIINRVMKAGGMNVPKDDCAFVPSGRNYLLFTTDQVSFDSNIPQGTNPELIGSFLASINLSDIAAMAGIPDNFLASLSVPTDYESSFIESLYAGMKGVLSKFNTQLIGGDTKEAGTFVASGFAVGHQLKNKTCFRSSARKGQVLGVTNRLGKSGSGYIFWTRKYRKATGIRMMLDVAPRIREAQILSDLGVRFITDLSDGLFSSAWQMKEDYGIGFKIVEDEIPLDPSVDRASKISGNSTTQIAAAFGGDYELLFSIDNGSFSTFKRNVEGSGIDVSFIGEVWDGDNIIFNGESWRPILSRGYEHFRPIPLSGDTKEPRN
jgi:thiamine-monophosphate kinase